MVAFFIDDVRNDTHLGFDVRGLVIWGFERLWVKSVRLGKKKRERYKLISSNHKNYNTPKEVTETPKPTTPQNPTVH